MVVESIGRWVGAVGQQGCVQIGRGRFEPLRVLRMVVTGKGKIGE